MPTESDTGGEAGSFLSIRSSCDRCRVQKLKCSVPPGSGACERCTRAKLPCAFGRRTRSKRQSSNDERQTTGGGGSSSSSSNLPATRTMSPAIQGPPPTPLTSVTPRPPPTSTSTFTKAPQAELLPTPASYMQLAGPMESMPMHMPAPAPASAFEQCSYDIRTWDNLNLGFHDSPNEVLDCESDMGNYSWTQSGLDMADTNLFDSSQLEQPRWPSEMAGSTVMNWPIDVSTTSNNEANVNMSTAVPTSQRLIALVSEIEQLLRKLEEGPWYADSVPNLDDYPVGTVLQLSQQFGAMAGLALNTTCVVGGVMIPCREEGDGRAHMTEGSEDGSTDNDVHDEKKSRGAVLDMPTVLLLLSGYLWLVRIFDVVLGHFQRHLNRMPNHYNHSGSNCSCTVAAGRTLRLGELHYANAALSLQRIHIAVSMLLDALQHVEGHLGRGGKVVRDLAVALLLHNPGRRQDDGSGGGLSKKATAVKELLREKMGL